MARRRRAGMDRRTFLKEVSAGAVGLAGATGLPDQAPGSPPDRASASPPAASRADRVVYRGERLRAVAMPLGGIGTGSIALAGDGGLRQWQIVHNVDHLAHVPHSFFAIWAKAENRPSVARVLQSSALYDQTRFKPPATTNDHVVPGESRRLLELLPGVRELEFAGEYPIAEVRYLDPELPVQVALEAYSPFIPLDSRDSGLPVIVFEFKLKNTSATPLRASILGTLQNFVGWDGHSPIAGVENFAYGANRNTLRQAAGLTALAMSNARLPADFPFQGSLVLAALADPASSLPQWDDPKLLWEDFSQDGALSTPAEAGGPSAEGRTWNGALAVPIALEPGQEQTAVFLLAWHFPNRYVNWEQPAFTLPDKKTKFWVGVRYATWFKNAEEVVRYVQENFTQLSQQTRLWRDTFYNSTLPYELLDCVSSQTSIIRTPTCIWVEDGHFHGFEGCCGASTTHCQNSGCCPLNCTHVWNYEQALSRLFPELARTMRSTDFEVQQAPAGYIPHRTIVPFYLPRAWDRKIYGPENPALDGMLGAVLKVYREYRQGAGREWLERLWPHVMKLMDYVRATLDPEGEGVIRGEQPNTYDISIYGPNSFMGTLYLAALRAAEEMALLLGHEDQARRFHQVYERGRLNLPRECWNGEYYIQKVDLERYPSYQYATGCHADQLLGQWWAHQLGLGYLLPVEQVRATLRAIMKYNWRESFAGFNQTPRIFASDQDRGLLICTWPRGGRPKTPTNYSDEVWTGIEYEVAGLLLQEGMVEDALKLLGGVRARYDGRERSPWNDVECGDHYARAMSSWTLLEAASGQRHDAGQGLLAFAPKTTPEHFRCPFVTAGGWGTFEQRIASGSQVARLAPAYGKVNLRELELAFQAGGSPRKASAALGSRKLSIEPSFAKKTVRVRFPTGLDLGAGDSLEVVIS